MGQLLIPAMEILFKLSFKRRRLTPNFKSLDLSFTYFPDKIIYPVLREVGGGLLSMCPIAELCGVTSFATFAIIRSVADIFWLSRMWESLLRFLFPVYFTEISSPFPLYGVWKYQGVTGENVALLL